MAATSKKSTTMAGGPFSRAVAIEELNVLEKLADGVGQRVHEFSETRRFQGKIDNTELALHEQKYSQLNAYKELASACYARTILGTEVDEAEKPKGTFVYRITQANVGYVDGKCFVLARNSPLASALVTALPGDAREVSTKAKDRFFDVGEVRTFDGPVSLLSPTQKPNFRSASIRRVGVRTPVVFYDLRSTAGSAPAEARDDSAVLEPAALESDPGWISDWTTVSLAEAEELSLGHQFFTQTTGDQERVLNNPRGLTFVEGIAGSGKTSVALGRLKFFANFATGVEAEHYGLQNAPHNDFSPAGMVGFVLSPSLKRYLKDTASMLGMERLPIRDFEEFRIDLCGMFEISDNFRRIKNGVSQFRGRLNWLRALDAAMARAAGKRLLENLADIPSAPPLLISEITKIANTLLQAESSQANADGFHLDGLAQKIIEAVADAELRARESSIRQSFQVRQKVEDERYRREKASLEREMRTLQLQAERKNISTYGYSLLSGIAAHELISAAINLAEFPTLVLQGFGPSFSERLGAEISEIRKLFTEGAPRPSLLDIDLVNLACLAGLLAEGFDYVDQKKGLKRLRQMRAYTAIFIDEVQDFDENEVFLMGMATLTTYNQITLSGDRQQRLETSGALSYGDLFPKVPRSQRNREFFFDHNFRQREELAAFSANFRYLIQGDNKLLPGNLSAPLVLNRYSAPEQMAEFLQREIQTIPRNASIVVIAPSFELAEFWFELLEDELESFHRPPRLSRRDDLTRRVNVHFTEVRETKGLEFDVAIVPDLTSFSWETDVGRNQVYVAITRPRHSLLLGNRGQGELPAEIEKLQQKRLLHARNIFSH